MSVDTWPPPHRPEGRDWYAVDLEIALGFSKWAEASYIDGYNRGYSEALKDERAATEPLDWTDDNAEAEALNREGLEFET